MAKIKVELNHNGVRELLRSAEMRQICAEHARGIAARCGNGYETDAYTGANRVNAMVWPETAQAKRDNEQNNTILKAMR